MAPWTAGSGTKYQGLISYVCVCVCVCVFVCQDFPSSFAMTCGQHVESSRRFCFMDRDYRYKLVANQIPHNAELAPVPFSGRKFLPNRDPKQHFFPLYEFEAVGLKSHYPVLPDSPRSLVMAPLGVFRRFLKLYIVTVIIQMKFYFFKIFIKEENF